MALLAAVGLAAACSSPPGPADPASSSPANQPSAPSEAASSASASAAGPGSSADPATSGSAAPYAPVTGPVGPSGASPGPAPTGTAERPFAASSPFNVPVAGDPAVDPDSAAMVARISRAGLGHANLVEFGIPIYEATADTPRHPVRCTITEWGVCPMDGNPRPIPDDAVPNPGRDGAMVVIDRAAGTADEYFQAAEADGTWTTGWGEITSLTGSGWDGGTTGAGASRLGGVIRVAEIGAGAIPHALVLESDTACSGTFRPPALKTDGESDRADCIPEGAHLQLDPSIDVAAIPDITPGEIAVARALQQYGGYLIDRADTSLAIGFEVAPDASPSTPGAVYSQAGLAWDYYGMPHIPWDRLRVLAPTG
ncbi:hypothetical protein [Nakamurella sp.]|uniref:hypothetical protein n=1 Tax=Nakamurella sp. TaxID=1869182 RepID=UPI003B3A690C